MSVVLQVRGLAKRYGDQWALGGIDLDVKRGEVFGFLGPNGAGKTTFTKCTTGFVRPQRGSVHVLGIDALAHPTRAAPHFGLVPDQYDFYTNLTGRQHLDFYGRLYGMNRRERKDRIDEMLARVRMEEGADKRTKAYSHGMKQRICIAQAMMHQPDVIFFDEPTNGLDPKGAYELRVMIRDLAKDGTTVFLNSHLLNEVEQTCGRVAVLDRGRLLTVETVANLRRAAAGGGEVRVRLLNPAKKFVTTVGSALQVNVLDEGGVLRFPADEEGVAKAVAALAAAGAKIAAVTPAEASLESAFLKLTEEST
jgi:ABC-2 type transport system ATP-binding protein